MASRPELLSEISRKVDALPWAEVHFSDPRSRLVVTLEASDIDESMERMKQLQAIPRVLSAGVGRVLQRRGDDVNDPTRLERTDATRNRRRS